MRKEPERESGFTFVELITVLGILTVITATAVPAYRRFQRESDLADSAEKMLSSLKLAQSKTLASEQDDSWGVHFPSSTSPYAYTLFKGDDFPSRNVAYDQETRVPDTLEVYDVSLGTSSDVIFSRLTGAARQAGTVSLRLKSDYSKTKTIIVEESGQVFFSSPTSTDQGRVKDSRHVHVDYTRSIDTNSESVVLTFFYDSSSVVKNISISTHITGGQLFWQDEVDVDGDAQKIIIHTHSLNDPVLDTQFCIHRDSSLNDKALEIELSGDSTGEIIKYDEYSQTTKGTSIYASEPSWQ